MTIETYSDKYCLDVMEIVDNFHKEIIKVYDPDLDKATLMSTILNIKENNVGNTFLLIVNDKCEGLLAGIEMTSLLNKKRTFQELIWYVNAPFRKYGVQLLKRAQEMLKAEGFNNIIMAVLESGQTEKIKRLYERMGFMLFESHYLKVL